MIITQHADIQAVAETRSENYGDATQLKSLHMGELYIDEISGNVRIIIKFKPDQYPTYTEWQTLNFCATTEQCAPPTPGEFTCSIWKPHAKSYFAAKVKLPQPPETCNDIGEQPINLGNEFQFRLEVAGSCRIRMFKTTCKWVDEPSEGECQGTVECVVFEDCGTNYFTYDICDALPTVQVCNTEQTASCPDGSNEHTVAAGTFCTTVTAPTEERVAAAQAIVDAQAATLAESQVEDCAWVDMVWSVSAININPNRTGATTSQSFDGGEFEVNAQVPCNNPNSGSLGLQLQGDINFTYKDGTVTHHNLSGLIANIQALCGGTATGCFGARITLARGPNTGSLSSIYDQLHIAADADKGIGTYPIDFDFTDDGVRPRVYRLTVTQTVYCQTNVSYNQTTSGTIAALD
jgi:hypothetical protein